jgi:hypothetical protein
MYGHIFRNPQVLSAKNELGALSKKALALIRI